MILCNKEENALYIYLKKSEASNVLEVWWFINVYIAVGIDFCLSQFWFNKPWLSFMISAINN